MMIQMMRKIPMIIMMMIVSLESELHGQTGVTPLTAQ